MHDNLNIFFIGDIVGKPGRRAVRELLPSLIDEYAIDLVIANGENASGGFGLTPEIAEELVELEVDVITSGNHIWDKKNIIDYIDDKAWLLRPANYPSGVPGIGSGIFETPIGLKVGVVNLEGRVFMDPIDCPFRKGDEVVERMKQKVSVIIVDFHAEATSEKVAMGWFMDGKVSAVIGTHTHVQTSDERLLPKGTAYMTDAGMTGSADSIIGVQVDKALKRFLTKMPQKFETARKNIQLQGAVISVASESGKAVKIERVRLGLSSGI
jgi:metallophosphoesterase (TIGR00282 family)